LCPLAKFFNKNARSMPRADEKGKLAGWPALSHKKTHPEIEMRLFVCYPVGLGGFSLLATLGFFARQCNRGAHTLAYKFHQTTDNPLVGVDTGAGQNLAAIA